MNSTDADKLQRQIDRLKLERERLHALLNITKKLSIETNLEKLLFKIMDEVRDILNADRCTVFLYDENNEELWSKIAIGLEEEIRFPADKGIAGHVWKTGEIVNIPDAYKDDRFNPEVDKRTGYKTKSILSMPLLNLYNEVIGVFQVLNRKGGAFTKENEKLLSAISFIAASAIENALLYEEQQKSFTSFIETLSTTLDTRD